MYLSSLMVDTGGNPDRPRPGRRWLQNVYHVHQRLCMGFPVRERVEADPDFLQPFVTGDFPHLKHPEHRAGEPRASFLFRIDNGVGPNGQRTMVLVQSEQEPNWDYAFRNAPMFLAAPPQVRHYAPQFTVGQTLRFRVRMNLSKKAHTSRDGTDLRKVSDRLDVHGRPKAQGKRVALTWDGENGETPDGVVWDWFGQKATRAGFEVADSEARQITSLGWLTARKPKRGGAAEDAHRMVFRTALLEGRLVVRDPEGFLSALRGGISAGKAFGFGLLSVAPA